MDWLQIRLWQLFHEGRDDTIEGHRGGPKETATPRARRLHVTMNGQTDGLRSAGMIKKASRASDRGASSRNLGPTFFTIPVA